MGISIQQCERCGTRHFPERLVCWCCGGSTFEFVSILVAMVEEITTKPSAVTSLATLRAEGGVRFIARVPSSTCSGDLIGLTEDVSELALGYVPRALG